MIADRFVRALREDPTIFASMQGFLSQQREKIGHKLALCDADHEIFRLQGELRGLTNIVLLLKTVIGVKPDARPGSRP